MTFDLDSMVDRSLAPHREAYAEEVAAIVEATYRVIARTGSIDPPVRAILAEAGLSNPAFYRHFSSKDELLLMLLDAGRRQLASYLDLRMAEATSWEGRIEEWVRGVMAQASDPVAAERTRPFVMETARLHDRFPEQQARSEALLVDQLAYLLTPGNRSAANLVYRSVLAQLELLLRDRRAPTSAEVDRLVRFVIGGVKRAS